MIKFLKDHVWIALLILAIGLVPYSLITQNELNLRVLMTAVAVDKTEDKYTITAQVIMSGDSGGQGSEQLEFFSIESSTMAEGLRNIAIEIGKTLGLSQIDYLLLGESMLESDNIFSDIDFFYAKQKTFKLNTNIYLSRQRRGYD